MIVKIAKHDFTIQWDGIYYFALSNYPRISPWELKKLLVFMDYEKHHGRETKIVCDDEAILGAVNHAINHPETVMDAALPEKITECTYCRHKGCLTRFVCHTATIENARKILESGKLLSAVKAFGKATDELVLDARNAAGDPADYFDYIMFAWGNCQAGDRLVMERNSGGSLSYDAFLEALEKDFSPGVRFYFRYSDIIRHPGYVFDGYHPAMVKNELILADYLYACIIPEQNRDDFAGIILPNIANKLHYLPQNGRGLLDWTEKVYDFISNYHPSTG